MDFKMTREQELFKQTVRDWCVQYLEPRAREIDEKEAGIPADILKGLADIGVFGCTIPEKYGGCAMPGEEMQYANIAIHELARAELSMSVPVYALLTIGWGGFFLAKCASEELKKEILPRIASGEWAWGICVTEPGGGSDVAAVKTMGIRKGNKFILNGEKAFISQAAESQKLGGGHCTLVVSDPAKGIKGGMTLLAVMPKGLKGVSSTTYRDMGRMGLSTGGFVYKDCEIPEKYILGEEGRGFYYAMEGFNPARALVSAACLGAAEKCIEIAADYAKQREAFGQTISKFQGVSFPLVEDYTQLAMLKLLLEKGCWMIDQYYANPGSITQKDINVIIAQAKGWAPNFSADTIKRCIMTLGGFGYTKESPLEMALRGVMSYVAGAEGAMNIMKTIIARDVFGGEFVSKAR